MSCKLAGEYMLATAHVRMQVLPRMLDNCMHWLLHRDHRERQRAGGVHMVAADGFALWLRGGCCLVRQSSRIS